MELFSPTPLDIGHTYAMIKSQGRTDDAHGIGPRFKRLRPPTEHRQKKLAQAAPDEPQGWREPNESWRNPMNEIRIQTTIDTIRVTDRTGRELAAYRHTPSTVVSAARALRRSVGRHITAGGTLGNYQW